jgi:hypothetical protein
MIRVVWFHHSEGRELHGSVDNNNTWWSAQVMKLLITHSSLVSRHLTVIFIITDAVVHLILLTYVTSRLTWIEFISLHSKEFLTSLSQTETVRSFHILFLSTWNWRRWRRIWTCPGRSDCYTSCSGTSWGSSVSTGTGLRRCMNLTTRLHLVPRLRMLGAIPPLLQYVFMSWYLIK